ncbi:DmsE family decaheme c-type cytochrome [Proteobacteria bacterium 005FR1]|nr:DmsE family decaheme c-type cytochrome [Proteobacteria bacterium 005FR1]
MDAVMPARLGRAVFTLILFAVATIGVAQQEQQRPDVESSAVATDNQQAFAPGGAETCLTCHGPNGFYPVDEILHTPHAQRSHPDSPFGEGAGECQQCHGPSAAHVRGGAGGSRPKPAVVFSPSEAPELKNQVCLDCHRSDVDHHWAGSIHQFEELACIDCHDIHTTGDPVLGRETQSDLCLDCHRRQRADFMRPSAHPVREGLQVCSDCHQPHGSAGPSLLNHSNINDTCYECHAEKRGPFLFEHAPVREDCSNCHVPHGSNHQPLLQARTPWLCQQCHLAQFHPSTALGGTSVPPRGASHLLLGKACLNCHSNIHGSNHPSGPRLVR